MPHNIDTCSFSKTFLCWHDINVAVIDSLYVTYRKHSADDNFIDFIYIEFMSRCVFPLEMVIKAITVNCLRFCLNKQVTLFLSCAYFINYNVFFCCCCFFQVSKQVHCYDLWYDALHLPLNDFTRKVFYRFADLFCPNLKVLSLSLCMQCSYSFGTVSWRSS